MNPTAAQLLVILKARDELSGALDIVSRKTSGLGKTLQTALKTGAIAGGVALAGVGVAAAKMAMDFESSMAEVRTLLPEIGDKAFGALRQDVLDFSKEMGVATTDAVPALYQAISAGVPPDNVLDFMEVAAKASIGGVTDLETAVDGITSVVNAYGAEVVDAQKAADIMFTGVRLGKTDFEQLSAALYNVVPTASGLGVSFEEVTAALATMTAQGVPTSVATTKLRQAFVEASKTGTKLDAAIKDLYGTGFAGLVKEGGTASGILDGLRDSMPEQAFRDLFGSVEAADAALAITGPHAEAMASALEEAGASAGALDEAFKTVDETTSRKLSKAMNYLKVVMIEVGAKALPVITAAIEELIPFFEKTVAKTQELIREWGPRLQPIFESFKLGVQTILEGLKAFWDFLSENKPLMIAAIAAVGVAIVVALGPGAAAMLAIVGIITAIGWLRDNWDEIKAKTEEIWNAIDAYLGPLIDGITESIMDIVETCKDVIEFFKAIFQGDWEEAWGKIKEILADFVDLFLPDEFFKVMKGIFEAIKPWEWVQAAIGEFATMVTAAFTMVKDAIVGPDGIIEKLKTLLAEHWKTIVQVALAVLFPPAGGLFWIATHFETVKETVLGFVTDIIDAITGLPGDVLEAVTDWLNAGKELAGAFLDGLEEVFSAGRDVAGNIAREIVNAIIALINTQIIDRINSLLEFTIPVPMGPDIHINPPPIGHIPSLALGTRDFLGGLALVGERGPELVNLPRGSRVFSHGESQEMGGNITNINYGRYNVVLPNVRDHRDFLKQQDRLFRGL